MAFVGLLIGSYTATAIFGALCLFTFAYAFLAPIDCLKQMKESSNRVHNGKTFETVTKFGDNISISEGTFSLTVEYSQIQKIYSLKYSYILMFGKYNAIILSPDGFTTGTFEDFKRFIETKANGIKPD